MKNFIFILFLLSMLTISAQTFTGNTGAIPDGSCDVTNEFSLVSPVVGIGVLGPGGNSLDRVTINITHAWDEDLDISLIAPDGTSVELTTDNGGSDDNYTGTNFTLTAVTSIVDGVAPFTGDFLPEMSLLGFNGVDADAMGGNWILQVCDDVGVDAGTLVSWEINFSPYVAPNDDPAGAIALTVGAAFGDNDILDSNIGATDSEIADPSIPVPGCANYQGEDMWYSVIVPPSGTLTLESNSEGGSTLTDTGMAVYSGPIGTFILVECDDDDSPDGFFSQIALIGRTPGETLYVRVWEFGSGTQDTYRISAFDPPPPPPANDEPSAAVVLTVGTSFADQAVVGTNADATNSEVADPTIPAPGCGGYTGGDIWYSVVVPASGNLSIGTYLESGSPVIDTGIAVYSGPIGALVVEGCDDSGGQASYSRLDLTGQAPGMTLYIRVWEGGNNAFGDFQVSAWENPIVNDEPASATTLIVGAAFLDNVVLGTNLEATASEVADPTIPTPACANYQGGDVWYSVVVPASGNVIIGTDKDSASPITDTGIAVYSGPIGALVDEGCDDFNGSGSFSRVGITGQTPGATLYVRVWEDGNNVFGEFQVSAWDPPAATNDDPSTVIALTVGADFADQAVAGTNVGATASEVADPTIPAPGCASYNGGDVWFSVEVPSTGRIIVETNSQSGSQLTDTGMAIYSGPVGAFVLEECDDDESAEGLFSLISLTGRTAGETLYVRVWEFGNNVFDSFQISAYNPPPSNDDPVAATALTVGVNFAANAVVGDNVAASASEVADPTIPVPGCASYSGGDVWYQVTVPASGGINLETNSQGGSAIGDTGMAVYSGPIGAFVLEECDDDDSDDGLFSLISLTGRTPGETLYARVWEFGNNSFGSFQVSAWDPNTLGIEDFHIEGLSYYPNPVKDILTIETQSTSSQVTLYSVNGQEIMRQNFNSNNTSIKLDMSNLSRGLYFVKITIDGRLESFKVIKE
jgi:hypothetical protein